MPSFHEVLADETKKPAIIDDCMALIDAEVGDKSGISGLAIKAGFSAVKGVKPGFVRHVVTDLLPEFASALSPLEAEARGAGKPIGEYFVAHKDRVADALLAITDVKAAKSKSGVVKGTYDKLRGSAKKNVESAIPRLGTLVEKYTK